MPYLLEHRDVVLSALEHSGDLLAAGGNGWSTTLRVRNREDARTLWQMLEQAVLDLDIARGGSHRVALTLSLDPARTGESSDSASSDAWTVRVDLEAVQARPE